MKIFRLASLALALLAGGMGSAYAHDSFGLSINLGIPGYYASPPPVYYSPPPAVYYEPAPIVYDYRPRAYLYYEQPQYYYNGDHAWHRHHRHHDRRWRDDD